MSGEPSIRARKRRRAANAGGVPELIEDGREGLLFPPGDASALAFRLKVRDRRQLAQVVRSIRTIPGVVRVSRSAS